MLDQENGGILGVSKGPSGGHMAWMENVRCRSMLVPARVLTSLVLALLVPAKPTVAVAEPVQVHGDYLVTLVGLPVAYLSFVTKVDGASYHVTGTLRTSALSDIVSKTRGTASVSGRLSGDRFLASQFSVAYSSGRKAQRTDIEFRDGNVESTTHDPVRKARGGDWVPLSDKDLSSVLDPLSGLLFPAGSEVCPRSLPIFDGQSRVTLHLSPKGIRPFSAKGFKGDAIVCGVRFEPNAGYRKNSSAIVYLRNLTSMEVWYAKHTEGGFYAPVYVKVPTEVGQVIVAATRFGG
jgi:hypothetical protein